MCFIHISSTSTAAKPGVERRLRTPASGAPGVRTHTQLRFVQEAVRAGLTWLPEAFPARAPGGWSLPSPCYLNTCHPPPQAHNPRRSESRRSLTVARSFCVSPLLCRPCWITLPTSKVTLSWCSSSVSRSSLAVFLVIECCLFWPAAPGIGVRQKQRRGFGINLSSDKKPFQSGNQTPEAAWAQGDMGTQAVPGSHTSGHGLPEFSLSYGDRQLHSCQPELLWEDGCLPGLRPAPVQAGTQLTTSLWAPPAHIHQHMDLQHSLILQVETQVPTFLGSLHIFSSSLCC